MTTTDTTSPFRLEPGVRMRPTSQVKFRVCTSTKLALTQMVPQSCREMEGLRLWSTACHRTTGSYFIPGRGLTASTWQVRQERSMRTLPVRNDLSHTAKRCSSRGAASPSGADTHAGGAIYVEAASSKSQQSESRDRIHGTGGNHCSERSTGGRSTDTYGVPELRSGSLFWASRGLVTFVPAHQVGWHLIGPFLCICDDAQCR